MTAAAEAVATGEVTRAVRDTNSDAGPISEGDWIGLVRGDGIVVGRRRRRRRGDGAARPPRRRRAASSSPSSPAPTPTDGATAAIEAWLADAPPDVQVEVHHGGQPLYPYLFGVE